MKMGIFRRRKNKWIKDVIINESQISNNNIDENMASEIVYRESSSLPITNTEFGEDVNAGVTENAPYHNSANYKMVAPQDDDSTVNTHSS